MKVGVLTHHWLPNFGANLQALATVTAIRSLGHDPVVIDYRIPSISNLYKHTTPEIQRRAHEQFLKTELPLSELCHSGEDIRNVVHSENCDALIGGSDAILRLDKSKPHREDLRFPNPFWLDWARELGVNRTGFLAASCMGSNYFEQSRVTRQGIRDAVEKLTYCSVRDQWTEWMLRSSGVPKEMIAHCPDPTSMFSQDGFVVLTEQRQIPDEPFVLFGLYKRSVTSTWLEETVRLVKQRGYLTVGFPQPDSPSNGPFDINIDLPCTPMEWLSWLKRSAGYVGVRFHPIMIAQSFAKPFVAVDHYDTGIPFNTPVLRKASRFLASVSRGVSKTYDLCRRAGLSHYVIPARTIQSFPPARVVSLLFEQIESSDVSNKLQDNRATRYMSTLKSILD